jgi:hypothetical protein
MIHFPFRYRGVDFLPDEIGRDPNHIGADIAPTYEIYPTLWNLLLDEPHYPAVAKDMWQGVLAGAGSLRNVSDQHIGNRM